MPVFKLHGKYVIYFAGYKEHVSVYPILSSDAALRQQIQPYVHGRGTLRFALDKPLPLDLIKAVALALVDDNQTRTNGA